MIVEARNWPWSGKMLPEMVSALQSQYILGLDNDGSFVWIMVENNNNV
jgi:hypothetical protein